MTKILILNGDNVQQISEVDDERFLFIKTKSGQIYHMDLSDEKMYCVPFGQLGKGHQKQVIENLLN